MPLFPGYLAGSLVEHLSWRGGLVIEHDVGAIRGAFRAVDSADRHYLVVGLGIRVARERRWRTEQKFTRVGDAEWSYVLPLIGNSDCDPIHNRSEERRVGDGRC